jgi:hypothetical protein
MPVSAERQSGAGPEIRLQAALVRTVDGLLPKSFGQRRAGSDLAREPEDAMISLYSSEEENNKLFALADMMHALTLEILQRSSLRSPTHASSNNGASEPNPD